MNASTVFKWALLAPAIGFLLASGGCTSAADANTKLSDSDKALLAPGTGNLTPDQRAEQIQEEAKGRAAAAVLAKPTARSG